METQGMAETNRTRAKAVRFTALLLLGLGAVGGITVQTAARRPAQARAARKPAAPVEAASAPGVTVETVSLREFSHPIRVTGTLKSEEVVTLSTKATGLVRQVLATEGDRVRQGQLLVQIDDGELRAQRARAAGVLQAAEARLQQAITSRGIKNAAAQSDYRRAQQALAAAQTRLAQSGSLAQISATEVESSVASARASLQAAREQLKVRQEGARRQEKASAALSVARAEAQLAKVKGQVDRREQLLRDGAIAREEVENARRDYEAAQAEASAARQQADLVSEGSRSEEIRIAGEGVRQAEAALRTAEANRARRRISSQDVETAETAVRQAEAGLDQATAALAQRQWNNDEIQSARAAVAQAHADVQYYDQLIGQTRIYSPVNGVVSQRKTHVGETVSQGKNELMTLVATDTLYFEATAPEGDLPYLRPGQPAAVTLDARPGQSLAGVVREIIPVAEGTNRSVRLRISVPRSDEMASVVGGFARATVRSRSQAPVIAIPRVAVVSDEGERAVYVVADGRAHRRTVRLDNSEGDRVRVLDGLRPGDRIVVRGAETLTDGAPVSAMS